MTWFFFIVLYKAEDFSDKFSYFVMGSLSYFKSTCPKIRGNAAVFLGFINIFSGNYGAIF